MPLKAGGWTDQAIVEGLKSKDPAAGAALYDRVQDRVNRIVWRMLGPDPEHDDVVHQVFVSALDGIAGLRNARSLDSWMVGITLNTVRYELRRRKIRRLFRSADVEPADMSPDRDPKRQLLSRRFYATAAKLKPDDRIAFTLRLVEGYSLAEVAEALGCSLATVKRRIDRARKAFARQARQDPILAEWIGGAHG